MSPNLDSREMQNVRRELTTLREDRAQTHIKMRALHDSAEAENRDLNLKETEAYERLDRKFRRIDGKIVELETLHDLQPPNSRYADFVEDDSPVRRGSLEESNDFVRRWLLGSEGNETEVPKRFWVDFSGLNLTRNEHGAPTVEYRDVVKGTTTLGGFLVPTGFVPALAEHLVEQSAVIGISNLLVTEAGEDKLAPKTTAHTANAGIVAEGAPIPEADPTFGQVTLKAYKYASLHQASREIIEDSAINLVEYLARRAAEAIANGSGAHFVTGTGSGQPEGVTTNATVGTTAAGASAITSDEIMDHYHTLTSGYRDNGTWLMKDSTLKLIRKLKDTTNQYLWQPGLVPGAPDTLLGRPVVTDPTMPAATTGLKSILFGDFKRYYTVRVVRGVLFERSDDYAFANDLVTFRAILRTDGKVLDTTAVKAIQQA